MGNVPSNTPRRIENKKFTQQSNKYEEYERKISRVDTVYRVKEVKNTPRLDEIIKSISEQL